MEIVQIVWLVLVVAFVVLEASTATLVSIWFCGGAAAALVVSLIWPSAIAAQVVVFLVVSAALLAGLRPAAKKLMGGRRRVATNADANIGKVAQVVVEIQPGRPGRVKLGGLEWAARSDAVLQVGAWCKVLAIEGVKLVVEPAAQGA
ncbi:NfeD family protein [Ruminococcaceae bacterium OttesenSCG-928-D13]|nr:NfeD family protein [Ruminococcaceae bacterium OttesenSCG-928-D13]